MTETAYRTLSFAHSSLTTRLFLAAYRPGSCATCMHMDQILELHLDPPLADHRPSLSSAGRGRDIQSALALNRLIILSCRGIAEAPEYPFLDPHWIVRA